MPLPLTPITSAMVETDAELFKATQGYCLVKHGRKNIWLGMFTFIVETEAKRAQLRARIGMLGSEATSAYSLYSSYVTYQQTKSDRQSDALKKLEATRRLPVIAIGLSSTAYPLFPVSTKPLSVSFDQGFSGKFPELVRPSANRVDAIVVLAHDDVNELTRRARNIDTDFSGLATITWEKGFIKILNSEMRDHFGFLEGISQPVFFDYEVGRTPGWSSSWDPKASLEYILFPQPAREQPFEYGSLMAYVKFRTDPDAFDVAMNVVGQTNGRNADEAKSRALGRQMSGLPLVSGCNDLHDFDFANTDFSVCPGSAHIRKMNPRKKHLRSNRILRRSALYEDNDNGEKGILFQCFQSKLESGFETLFHWAYSPNIPETGAGVDSILAALPDADSRAPNPFTQVLGGEYFFFPSIPFFRRLNSDIPS